MFPSRADFAGGGGGGFDFQAVFPARAGFDSAGGGGGGGGGWDLRAVSPLAEAIPFATGL